MVILPKRDRIWHGLALTILLLLASPGFAAAENLAATEKHKIEVLINQVRTLKDAKFVRNGWSYSSDNAASFLRGKWEANAAEVKSAKDFIDRVASYSGTSGKYYLIRFKDGREIKSQEYLLTELKKLEAPVP